MNHIRLSGECLEIARSLKQESERVKERLATLEEENNRLREGFQKRCFEDGERIKAILGVPPDLSVSIDTQYLTQHHLAFLHVPDQPHQPAVIERSKRELN